MKRKIKPILILLGTLIIGFVIGGLFTVTIIRYKLMRFATEDGFKEATYSFFDPNDNQRNEMKPIVEKYSKKHNELRRTFFIEFFNMADSMVIELNSILTDDQKEKYLKGMSEHEDDIEKMMQ